jgi:hypothetical protein
MAIPVIRPRCGHCLTTLRTFISPGGHLTGLVAASVYNEAMDDESCMPFMVWPLLYTTAWAYMDKIPLPFFVTRFVKVERSQGTHLRVCYVS